MASRKKRPEPPPITRNENAADVVQPAPSRTIKLAQAVEQARINYHSAVNRLHFARGQVLDAEACVNSAASAFNDAKYAFAQHVG